LVRPEVESTMNVVVRFEPHVICTVGGGGEVHVHLYPHHHPISHLFCVHTLKDDVNGSLFLDFLPLAYTEQFSNNPPPPPTRI
jgi:hypothetical protein